MERIIHLRERDIHYLHVVQGDVFENYMGKYQSTIKSHGVGTFSI